MSLSLPLRISSSTPAATMTMPGEELVDAHGRVEYVRRHGRCPSRNACRKDTDHSAISGGSARISRTPRKRSISSIVSGELITPTITSAPASVTPSADQRPAQAAHELILIARRGLFTARFGDRKNGGDGKKQRARERDDRTREDVVVRNEAGKVEQHGQRIRAVGKPRPVPAEKARAGARRSTARRAQRRRSGCGCRRGTAESASRGRV